MKMGFLIKSAPVPRKYEIYIPLSHFHFMYICLKQVTRDKLKDISQNTFLRILFKGNTVNNRSSFYLLIISFALPIVCFDKYKLIKQLNYEHTYVQIRYSDLSFFWSLLSYFLMSRKRIQK